VDKETRAYKTGKAGELLMDVYPPEQRAAGKAPVHVFIHGGGWAYNDRDRCRLPIIWGVFQRLSSMGYTGVSIDYSLVDPTGGRTDISITDCIVDCCDAVRYLRKNADTLDIDPDRISIWGESAGGHLALMVGLSRGDAFPGAEQLQGISCAVTRVCSWYGPTDFTQKRLMTETGNLDYHERVLQCEVTEEARPFLEAISPIYYLRPDSVPILLVHGPSDQVTHYGFSEALYRRGQELGSEIRLVPVANSLHVWVPADGTQTSPSLEEIHGITAEFLSR